MAPDRLAQPGDLSPADGSGPHELLRYRSAQGRWVVAAMILGASVAGIDSTVVAVALPAIGRNLHATFQALQWTVTSYTLTLASLILLAGSFSDRWGRRRVFLVGLVWFTLASVLCAAAPDIGWLIGRRTVQGIGGALVAPGQPGDHRGKLPAQRPHPCDRDVGRLQRGIRRDRTPPPGGSLLEAGSWRAICSSINVPVAAMTAWTTRRHVPESRDTSVSGSVDWLGALTGVVALAAIAYGIIVLPAAGVASPRFAAAVTVAVVASVAFVVTERRARVPCSRRAIFAPARVPTRGRGGAPQCHLRRQRRPRRLRLRLHPRPGDHHG